MDPLSEVLSLLNTRSSYFAGLKAGGDWAIRFPPPEGIKFNAVVQGACWLTVEGVDRPVPLRAGDCFLLTQARGFSLGSDPLLERVDASEVYRHTSHGVAHHGQGVDFFLIGGRFTFGDEAALLVGGLPPVIVVNGSTDEASVLHWALQRLAQELSSTSPGASLMTQHLGHMMFVQVLRLYLAADEQRPAGWLLALSDPRMGAAIHAVHAQPARRWTVDELAAVAGVSRSTFALHFKQKVGLGPLEYVLRWRMQLATRELRHRDASISAIAESLGYESDSAFSNAFKRIVACSPRQYRERHAVERCS